MYSCQFFLGNPQSFTRQKITQNDINNCKKLLKKFPTSVFSHFPYIANLNGSTKSLAWNGDNEVDDKLTALIKNLEYELSVLANFSEYKSGVVIHPGSYPKRDIGLDTIAKTINYINFSENSKLLLENCAGEGNKMCKDFTEIKRVIDGVVSEKKQNIGVCVDTAHIYGSGIYNLSKCDEIDRLFYDFQNIIGMEYFSLIHLNDSEVCLGSKKDRHACLCSGCIWSKDYSSLIYLLNKAQENNIPVVMETTPSDIFTIFNLK
jgi:apurinic endonuclease APN1